ncbi:amino acid permease [Aeromicrobium duanguangcaii]|uniref:Amino acid permease n=1 Tax=Aeromicrobium duanguangcaii TaxID=2968086 RepID=A0ABY5KD62_9ACTN|nr:amino acid permease [Aeromicrobium duanguangcaii]MCD9154540.1 amino acid permease [Aeromicrobium duanguangcaii]MCL3838290.1 amino acid permease [Aeromicrobium duanguangcaii]UUI68404.1 amino acid permease [Aeromicrobium duanguangcaii]
MNLFRTKSIEQSIAETEEPEHQLKRDLTTKDLIVFGIGVIIGTGIFVLTGQEAHNHAGPAIVISFLIAGAVCALAALCYAEFAATVPVAGSAYTFSYATLGEFIAWIIGWDLLLELALGAAVVARGWSGYLQELLELPTAFAGDKAVVDVAAIAIVMILAFLVIAGTKLSSSVSSVFVLIKVSVVLFVVIAGLFYIKAANYSPFIPPSEPTELAKGADQTLLQAVFGMAPTAFGVMGIVAAASVVFFSYIGFDVVATTAEETRNPQRDVPRGILGSLLICTLLYMAVSFVITGMLPYTDKRMDTSAPLAEAFSANGVEWAANLISLGAVAGMITTILVLLLGQSRILFAMCRDGLLPRQLAKVHPKYGTPHRITLITSVVVAGLAGFVPLAELSHLVSIGTLFAFALVSAGVLILRRTRPDLPRAFRVKWAPLVAGGAILTCVWLMLNLSLLTWERFIIWMALGIVIYAVYGRTHSRLGQQAASTEQ